MDNHLSYTVEIDAKMSPAARRILFEARCLVVLHFVAGAVGGVLAYFVCRAFGG